MRLLDSLFYVFFGVFSSGFLLNFFRFPMHTIIMLVGIGGMLIIGAIYMLKKHRLKGILVFASSFWSILLLSYVKFWPNIIIFLVALVFFAVVVYLFLQEPVVHMEHQLILGMIIIVAANIGTSPKDERYYLLNIQFNIHIQNDYYAWDKYSWFLYNSGKVDEAILANRKAFEIVQNTDDSTMIEFIKKHKQYLKEDNWEEFKI